MLRKYLDFLGQPDVARLFAVALLARMPIGMVVFSMLMFLREAYGNFELAGSAVGLFFVAMAAAAPIQGRIIDRSGPRRMLRITGVVQPLVLAGIIASAKLGMPFAVTATFTALSGAFASPITTLRRWLWRYRFEAEEDRRIAYALDAVSVEINFTLGPAIVAAVLATSGATSAFVLSIAVVVASFLIYVSSGALVYFKLDASAERHLFGPLTEPRLWLGFIATFRPTLCFGLIVGGHPAFAGALIAPSIAAQNVLVSRLAPARYATEAFTWSSTFIVSGLGAGMALGGMLVENAGLRANFATGAGVVGAMALLTFALSASRARKPRASRPAP